MPMLKLNLGCGANKITGAINIDCEPNVKPDVICDFVKDPLPYEDDSAESVCLFHTIEHISKRNHSRILLEINRVLVDDGFLYISYPEFEKIVRCWLTNFQGKRTFWEATIYGRQLYPSDFHVCAIDSEYYMRDILEKYGFWNIRFFNESLHEPYNTVCICQRKEPMISYEQLIYNEICA